MLTSFASAEARLHVIDGSMLQRILQTGQSAVGGHVEVLRGASLGEKEPPQRGEPSAVLKLGSSNH